MSTVIPIGTPAAELAEALAAVERPAPGIYPNVEMETYLAWPCVSIGALCQIARSPAHAKAYAEASAEPRHDDPISTIIGSAMHTALLEPEKFDGLYVKGPAGNWTNKGPRDERAALQAAHPEALILKPDKFSAVLAACDSLLAHPKVAGVINAADSREVSIVWQDPEFHVMCKARPDLLLSEWRTVADLKTTIDASRQGFARELAKYAYDQKAAWYLDGLQCLQPDDFEHFVFIAAEKEEPYASAVYELEPLAIEAARRYNRRLLAAWAICELSNDWPAYPTDIAYIEPPEWRRNQLEAL